MLQSMRGASVVLVASLLATVSALPGRAADIRVETLTIGEVQDGLAAGTYSAEELTQATLARTDQFEPTYNAFTTINPNALEEARAIDERLAAGESPGPLAGVPIVIKDSIDVRGIPTTAGWAALASEAGGVDLIPATDAPVVARLRAAGAVIVGKTNLPMFQLGYEAGNSWAGPTYNAVDPTKSPGGSSAGTATAIAAGLAITGIGMSNAGSIEVPAAAQSLVGIKPTFALVPNTGGLSLSGTGRDVVGPLARTVRDAAIMLDVMAGYSAADPKTTAAIGNIPDGGYASLLGTLTLHGARVGLYGPGFQDTRLSPETAALYEAAVAELRDLGAETVDDPFAGTVFSNLAWFDPAGIDSRPMETLPYDLDQYLRRLGPDALARSLPELRRLADPFAPDGPMGFLMPLVAATIDNPEVLPDLTAFAKAREDYIDAFNEVFLGQEIDVLVFPTLATGVPALGTNPNPLLNPFPVPITVSEVNLAGLPAVVVPGGRYPDGAPFSLVFVGPLWSEAKLLAYAYDYEQATHHRVAAELEAPAGQ